MLKNEDGSVVQEGASVGARNAREWRRRQVRHLRALAGLDIQDEHLSRVLAFRARSHVGEVNEPAVRAEPKDRFGQSTPKGAETLLKAGVRLASPRRRKPLPSARMKKIPFCSGGTKLWPRSEKSSVTSNTTAVPSGLTPSRWNAPKTSD